MGGVRSVQVNVTAYLHVLDDVFDITYSVPQLEFQYPTPFLRQTSDLPS